MKKLLIGTLCVAAAVQFASAEENDAGVQAVVTSQAAMPQQIEAKTAKEKVELALDKAFGGRSKWRGKTSKQKITVVDVTYNMENPVTEEKLFSIRDMLSQRALLQAKVQLAESMSSEADASLDATEVPEVKAGDKVTKTFTSGITLAAKDPQAVFGATILNQAEHFDKDNGVYHLASAVVWSEGLKAGAAKLLDPTKPVRIADEEKSAGYMVEWLSKQELGTMCGPRQVITPDGERHFLGISSREVGKNAERSATNIRLAQMYAIQALLFSLYSDVSFQDAATNAITLITAGGVDGITQGDVVESLHRDIAVKAKKVLRGLDEIYGEEVVHPITGRKMYVSVYEMSASKAARAKQFSTDIAALRAKVGRADSAERAYNKGLQDAVKAAENDSSAAEKAKADAQDAVDSRLNPASMLPAAEGTSRSAEDAKRRTSPKEPKKGVFGGNENIDVNIL